LGTFKGAALSLANIIGFGTGTKSLFNYGKAALEEKKRKIGIDTSEAE
jgi:hypothetical protein